MAEIKRDIFPPNILQRMQTPVQRKRAMSDLRITRDRPFGNIIYPESVNARTPR